MRLVSGAAVLTILLLGRCQSAPTESLVTYVYRDQIYLKESGETADPLLLVVEIADGGKVTLNRIEVGTSADFEPFSEKLKAIFDDREKTGVEKRAVVIDIKGKVSMAKFERLIDSLKEAGATPVWVVRNDQ